MLRPTSSSSWSLSLPLPLLVPLTLLFAAQLAAASNATVEHWWNINWVSDVNPDGLSPRRVVGVNGTWPPPILNVNASDILRIHATNALDSGVGSALHCHGMFFNQTGWSDGAVGTTQCPIPPGQSFTYEPLNAPSSSSGRKHQSGTFWCHGHFKGQYVDGLRTPLVIHDDRIDAPKVHAYDEDYTIVLGDWYHDEHAYLLNNFFLNRNNPTGAEPVPNSGLLYIAPTPGAQAGVPQYLPGFNENVTLPFVAGRTYRLRIINMSALAMFHFFIDGHDMRIIEVDGVETEELPVEHFPLSAAQRYSVLVTARNASEVADGKDWKIHAHMDPDMFDTVPDDLQLNITARISYDASADPPRDFGEEKTFDEYGYFDDLALVPVEPEAMAPADISHNMTVVFDTYSDNINYATFNGIAYRAPNVPSIFTQTSMGTLANDLAVYGPTTGAFAGPHMAMVEMVIYNTDAGFHPFHLHGHNFMVVGKSQDVTSDDPSINPPLVEGQANPMRRDTVMVPPGGSATIRFRADNPGVWLFHCHIEWHLESGLGAILVEGSDQAQQLLKLPSQLTDQCRSLGIATSGNAVGLNSTTDFTGLAGSEPEPLVTGWTPAAIGSFVACLISAIIGLATILAYGWTPMVEDEEEEEEEKGADKGAK